MTLALATVTIASLQSKRYPNLHLQEKAKFLLRNEAKVRYVALSGLDFIVQHEEHRDLVKECRRVRKNELNWKSDRIHTIEFGDPYYPQIITNRAMIHKFLIALSRSTCVGPLEPDPADDDVRSQLTVGYRENNRPKAIQITFDTLTMASNYGLELQRLATPYELRHLNGK